MKPGLTVGYCAQIEDVIREDMRPAFDGHVVHPVYSTVAMVYHMEWAARQIILPFLDADEEGIGTGVQVKHLYPAPIGATIRAKATCTAIADDRITCVVTVYHGSQRIGEGEVEQRVVLRRMLHERFPDFWVRDELASNQ